MIVVGLARLYYLLPHRGDKRLAPFQPECQRTQLHCLAGDAAIILGRHLPAGVCLVDTGAKTMVAIEIAFEGDCVFHAAQHVLLEPHPTVYLAHYDVAHQTKRIQGLAPVDTVYPVYLEQDQVLFPEIGLAVGPDLLFPGLLLGLLHQGTDPFRLFRRPGGGRDIRFHGGEY